jgi:hypothetical protein
MILRKNYLIDCINKCRFFVHIVRESNKLEIYLEKKLQFLFSILM